MTPIYYAIETRNIDIVQLLISQPNIDINHANISKNIFSSIYFFIFLSNLK